MKRAISMLPITIAVGALVVTAGAAQASTKAAAKGKTVTLKCRISLIQQPPNGLDFVLPRDSGQHYGRVDCHKRGFGSGVIRDSFTIPDSGDTVGKYVVYLNRGTFSGTFALTPGGGEELTGTTYQSDSWTGTMTVNAGSGIYKRVALAKGRKGKMACKSSDSVHLVCQETISLALPATSAALARK